MTGSPDIPWPTGCAFVDGGFRPIEDATLSILDMGVTRGDSTYDVVHVWKGHFYRLDDHLDRFANSVAQLRLDLGRSRDELTDILHEVVRRTGLRDAFVSMNCTRGRVPIGSRDLRIARNTFYCYAIPFVWINTQDQQAVGTSMWISDMPRIPPESVDPTVKNYHWLDMDMALLEAYDHDATMVLLRDQQGNLTEGPGYNVFALVDGHWLTPVAGALQGITRQSVLELVVETGGIVRETLLTAEELLRADEVFVCSTAGGIMPVSRINNGPVGDGCPGPVTTELRDRYWARHDDPTWSTPVRY